MKNSIVFFFSLCCLLTVLTACEKQGPTQTSDNHHYRLPVVFHVLYKDRYDPAQYVSQTRLNSILNEVNRLYKDATNSVNMNLTFELATRTPDNKSLPAPGVNYVQWQGEYPIDFQAFMNDNSGKYVSYIWEPNQYINVMVYPFKEETHDGESTLGIAHLPYSISGTNFLEGLTATTYSLHKENLAFPYCVSINSRYINEQSTNREYSPVDITVTLAHELGHYLGLHHAFAEENGRMLDDCQDTDYCDDTPSYNKVAYDTWLSKLPKQGEYQLKYLARRSNCSGDRFISHNIMDYAYSFSDQFTPDQRDRIRHVLLYSPLIPGPKRGEVRTRAVIDEPIELPIRTAK